MPTAIAIQNGAFLEFGLGQDTDIQPYIISGIITPDRQSVIAELPGNIGEASPDAPNAILVRKRCVEILGKDSDGTWRGIGVNIFRSNNPFSGGMRPASGYARHMIDLDLPVYQKQAISGAWRRCPCSFERPMATKVKVVTVDELTEDMLTEKIDPLVGAITRFAENGHPYRLIGADTRWTPGAPKTVEYRFQTTGSVPEFDIGSQWRNDIYIPALPPLAQYAVREPDGGDPEITVADLAAELEEFLVTDLPGF